ncbi:MAG: hypothetical protein GF393_13015, partial [Armatimonadia bacterium]|nr:hypothetical protein [Armatimonadia bacterium]
MPEWKFRERRPSEQNSDPSEEEFFRREDAVASLVRESIQNSLDASAGEDAVRVRFFISGKGDALLPDETRKWLMGISAHLEATDVSIDQLGNEMPFISIEDFGTHGLRGSTAASRRSELPNDNEEEDFYYFWRNVGISGKGKSKRGSWGLGKAVYPSSSRIRSMFGWTCRSSSPTSVLMGQCVLKIHELEADRGLSKQHDSYGFYGEYGRRKDDVEFPMPTEDSDVIGRFKRQFRLQRKSQAGLSLVIPFPSEEFPTGDEPACAERYALEVLHQYAYPILARQLIVDIETRAKTFHLDREGLLALPDELTTWDGSKYDKDVTESFLLLADWAVYEAMPIRLEREDGRSARVEDLSFPGDTLNQAQQTYRARKPIALEVPVLVRPKDEAQVLSYVKVFLMHDPEVKGNAVRFIRQGLTLTEQNGPSNAGVLGIVAIEDMPLAQLLRDSENPAHTKWLPRAERLLKNYIGGAARVKLVEALPRKLLKDLLGTEQERDTDLLAEFFPDPDPHAVPPGKGPGKKKGRRDEDEVHPPPSVPKSLVLSKVAGGFSISHAPSVPLPSRR